MNQVISPRSYENTGSIKRPFFIGIVICVISVFCAFLVAYLDYESDKREGKLNEKNEDIESDKVNFSDIKKLNLVFWCICGVTVFSDGTTWTLYGI